MSYKGTKASHEALQPRYGGEIVEQLITVEGVEPSQAFNWADGYTVEVCEHGAYVTQHIPLELIARAGDAWPDETTIVRAVAADSHRNETRNRTETSFDREFDLFFETVQP